ncbi:AAA family ATPase [Maioricimonas sp. JC845]|uniref:AAA family ATPase n=1 Tax=Maioricimonas sp. JC845 TaxID=3232138 RepID=UPI00345797B3
MNPDAELDTSCFPGNLPFTRDLHLDFDSPVTFFVGENGSGKSTLLEAIAVLAGLPIAGGGTNETGERHGIQEQSVLAEALRMAFAKRPKDGYFFRAELQAHFASLLDQRRNDPEFRGNPYRRYGGQSLHTMSHGEAFLSVMQNRFTGGLFILDEPESALSPQRQLTLLALMYDRVRDGNTQFIVATHSPVLLTYPGSTIVSFDNQSLQPISLMDTKHFQITHGILSRPEAYWKHLRGSDDES